MTYLVALRAVGLDWLDVAALQQSFKQQLNLETAELLRSFRGGL